MTFTLEQREERRQARARHLAETAAMDAVRRMARQDEDVTSAAILAAMERAEGTGRADPIADAVRIVRQTRTDMARADVARMARETVSVTVSDGLTGQEVTMATPVREHRSVRQARVALQHSDHAQESCTVLAALVAWQESDHADERERATAARDAMGHRCQETATYTRGTRRNPTGSETVTVTASCGLCAVVAALLADGPSQRPDHDAATCARPGCHKCRALRRVGIASGALVKARKGGHRADRADRPPRERTTDRAVDLLRESDAAAMLDETRSMGAATPFDPSDPTGRDATDPLTTTEVAALMAIVTTAGRRGTMVAWHEAALRYGVSADAWREQVAGIVAERANLPTDHPTMRRHARAAGVSVAALATARTRWAEQR